MNRLMETGIGTPEYTDRYILFEGHFLEHFLDAVYPHRKDCRAISKRRETLFFEISLEQRCFH